MRDIKALSSRVASEATKSRFGFLDLAICAAAIAGVLGTFTWGVTRQRDAILAAAFQSPLPAALAAPRGAAPRDLPVYRGRYEFTQDWFGYHVPTWESILAPYKGKPTSYLEVGLYEGRSAVWMLEHILTNPASRLTGVDIFDGVLKERYLRNIAATGAQGKVVTLNEPSQVALRRLPVESFDVIYIDGSHAANDVLEDAVLSYRLLKHGGVIIFDDYQWSGALTPGPLTHDAAGDFPKAAIDPFVKCFRDLKVIHNGNQLVLRKQ